MSDQHEWAALELAFVNATSRPAKQTMELAGNPLNTQAKIQQQMWKMRRAVSSKKSSPTEQNHRNEHLAHADEMSLPKHSGTVTLQEAELHSSKLRAAEQHHAAMFE